ncbi:MAG TPA: hypothetical protein VMT75_10870 [Candidatus Saccharimonadales bacterium]|nr:hypothetical protein [Candidatus Saccharimonadales bacterium]
MSDPKTQVATKSSSKLSLDTWAVILALAAAALVRFGVISRVPW